jgi:thiamine-phosphate pyrophosphorylase
MKTLAVGGVVYTAMCYEHGGMIDDGTVFRLGRDNFRWIGGTEYGGEWMRELAEKLGLDGVHLLDGARSVRAARKALGPDAIVGCFCGQSRHDGLNAAEYGADYVSFGPISGALGDGAVADPDLFAWWSEVIEVPVVAEGGLTPDWVANLSGMTDFFAVGEEIWNTEDPVAALRAIEMAMRR